MELKHATCGWKPERCAHYIVIMDMTLLESHHRSICAVLQPGNGYLTTKCQTVQVWLSLCFDISVKLLNLIGYLGSVRDRS